MRTAIRTCPLCEATCGLRLTVDGDRVTHVEGDAPDVLSRGSLCPKGALIGELHADPDRLPHGCGHDLVGVELEMARRSPGANSNRLTDPADTAAVGASS